MHLLTTPLLLLLLLLWRSLYCASESTITHSTNVSKRQLQYGDNFPLPGYQQMNAIQGNQGANTFMQSSHVLYDPGYNAQHNHEVASELASRSANADLTTTMNSPNAAHHYQQRSQDGRKFDGMSNGGMGLQYEAPQTFSHIFFPNVYAPSSQHGPGRTAPHVFPGDTPAAMAARNSGQSYSTSSTYFVPMSVLYHPNVGPQQHYIHPQRQVQQQQQQHHHHQQQQQQPQQMQAYNPLLPPLPPPPPPPPSAAQYQNYASQISPPPPPLPPPPPSPQSHQQQQPTHEQQQSTSQQTVYQRHSQQSPTGQTALPPPLPPLPLPRLPPLPHGQQSPQLPPPPPPLNFQAPFRASQFLGYMQDDARGAMQQMGAGADPRAPLYTEAYPMMGAMPLQQPLVKPIYERMRENFMNEGAQQNFQGPTTQHARYGRYIYMAPRNVYALFKAA